MLLECLESPDFYSRLYALQLLSNLLKARPTLIQKCLLSYALGISRLVASLNDNREAVRNGIDTYPPSYPYPCLSFILRGHTDVLRNGTSTHWPNRRESRNPKTSSLRKRIRNVIPHYRTRRCRRRRNSRSRLFTTPHKSPTIQFFKSGISPCLCSLAPLIFRIVVLML